MVYIELQKAIFEPCYDKKYGKISLLNLYFKDKLYFSQKIKSNVIDQDVIEFFELNAKTLEEIDQEINIQFFREQKFMELLKLYYDNFKDNNLVNKEKVCYKNYTYEKILLTNGYQMTCPNCGESRDEIAIFKSGIDKKICCVVCMRRFLKNVAAKKEKKKRKNKEIDTLIEETQSGKLRWEVRRPADPNVGYIKYIALTESRLGKDLSLVKITDNDQKVYFIKTNNTKMQLHKIWNLEDVIMESKPSIILTQVRKKTEAEIEIEKKRRLETVQRKKEIEEEKRTREEENRRIQRERKEKDDAERARKRQEEIERALRAYEENKIRAAQGERRKRESKDNICQELETLPQIGIRDFVVRDNVFKCMHSAHKLENIVAAINVIDQNGDEKLVKVNAGYCRNCKIYFIMESSFDALKHQGIPICRVSDEKTYLKNNYVNGMLLAQESVLMQYGYNVNQNEGLSSTRRQKILAVLIDKKILSKSEIISYLDFFVSQRQGQDRYLVAISKWEADREFVENYRIGEYHQYGVNAIYRR